MRSHFKHIYYHNDAFLCEEIVENDIMYKIKIEMEQAFFLYEDGWCTDGGGFASKYMLLKMAMWKMVGDEIHYKSTSVVDEEDWTINEEF